MYCNLRPSNVAPVVLGFNYKTHTCVIFVNGKGNGNIHKITLAHIPSLKSVNISVLFSSDNVLLLIRYVTLRP